MTSEEIKRNELLKAEAKKQLITSGSNTMEGAEARKAIAAEMGAVIQPDLDQFSTARRIFQYGDLTSGGDAIFPVDIENIDAWVLPPRAKVPQNIVHSGEVAINTFSIGSSVEWELRFARMARFDVVSRSREKLQRAIIEQEESYAWSLIDTAVTAYDGTADTRSVDEAGVSGVTKVLLNMMWTKMQETSDFKINLLVMSPTNAAYIREWSSTDTTTVTHAIDAVTQREIWLNFGLTNVWGADVMVVRSPYISDTYIYGFDTGNFGWMPVRLDFVTYDDPTAISSLRQKVIGTEEVGFGITDIRACVRGVV
jgi:hypothetical protein